MATVTQEDRSAAAHGSVPRTRRLLFVKERLAWPRSSGHDIHTYYLMRAMAEAGHAVALATIERPTDEAVNGLPRNALYTFGEPSASEPTDDSPVTLTKWQEKFRSYWGIDPARIRRVAAAAKAFDADAVIVVGLNVLPYLGAVTDRLRVWYAADEWVWHHLSQVKPLKPGTWRELRPALVKGMYERAYAPLLDRVWVVSPADARAFRWVIGGGKLDVIPYGADTDYFAPGTEESIPNSCAFWGRLDFGPNVQAIEWFVRKVWPRVRARVPTARFDVFGFQPTPEVERHAGRDGITLTPNVPDLRPALRARAVAVLPFVSGGGIKNKLLEAAGMGMAVVGTPRVTSGMVGGPPIAVAKTPSAFSEALMQLWADQAERARVGRAARGWVMENHTWPAAARAALAGLDIATRGRT